MRKKQPAHVEPLRGASPLGQLIVNFRARGRISVRELAKRIGITHPTLSAIETGASVPSKQILDAIAESLQLDDFDRRRLDLAREMDDPEEVYIPPGTIVSARKLIAFEADRPDELEKVFIVTLNPMELEDDGALQVVQKNLKAGCEYVYLLGLASLWSNLYARIVNDLDVVTPEVARQQITCIAVPEILHTFFLNPERVLFVGRKEDHRSLVGLWIFRGSRAVQSGCEMHEFDAYELYQSLSRIVDQARLGKAYIFSDRPVELAVLHAPKINMVS